MSVDRCRVLALSTVLVLASLVSAPAFANSPFAATASDAAEFRAQAADVRSSMKPGGRYADVSVKDQQLIGKQLDRLQEIYDKRGENPITPRQQTAIVNATSEINALLTGDEDQRVICEQVKKTGSNRPERVCQTMAQKKASREESKKTLHEYRPSGRMGGN